MAKLLAKHQSYCQAQVIFKNEVKRIITHISYFTHEIILHLKIHPEFPGKKHLVVSEVLMETKDMRISNTGSALEQVPQVQ